MVLGPPFKPAAKSMRRYDPASLAILQRLDDLEVLVRSHGAGQTVSHIDGQVRSPLGILETLAQTSPQSGVFHSLENHHLANESLLSWPVFDQILTDRLPDIKQILKTSRSYFGPPTVLDFDTLHPSSLLQIFLNDFHIYNPILHVPTVQLYVEQIRLNGLGWDAKSCLLVCATVILSYPVINLASF
jgi:hypothetical protein